VLENTQFVVRNSALGLSVVVSEIKLFTVLAALSLFPVVGLCRNHSRHFRALSMNINPTFAVVMSMQSVNLL